MRLQLICSLLRAKPYASILFENEIQPDTSKMSSVYLEVERVCMMEREWLYKMCPRFNLEKKNFMSTNGCQGSCLRGEKFYCKLDFL